MNIHRLGIACIITFMALTACAPREARVFDGPSAPTVLTTARTSGGADTTATPEPPSTSEEPLPTRTATGTGRPTSSEPPVPSATPILARITTPSATPIDLDILDRCSIPAIPTPLERETDGPIYFREGNGLSEDDGWYRTDDLFATAEPVAPWGYLSRDLENLVTFDCDGVGSICVASPPTAEPRVMSVRYELDYDPRSALPPISGADWLADNKRLVFGMYTSYRNPEDPTDFANDQRLYFLNVETGNLELLDNDYGTEHIVSPDGECVLVRRGTDASVEVLALGSDGVSDTLRLPDRIANVFPLLGEYDWSPDGRKIATTDTKETIDILDLQTAAVQIIDTCDHCMVTGLRWGPDSGKLFFTDVDSLYTVDADTEKVTREGASFGVSGPDSTHWLPEGRSLVIWETYGSMVYRLGDLEHPPSYEPLVLPDGRRSRWVTDLFWTSQDMPTASP